MMRPPPAHPETPDLRDEPAQVRQPLPGQRFTAGAGQAAAAAEWAEASEASGPLGDAVDHLDRVFAIRVAGDDLYQPMSPEAALGVLPDERAGEWFIVRADYPAEARSHVRTRLTDPKHCQAPGPCRDCAADLLAIGPYDEITSVLAEHSTGAIATTTAVATPYSPPPAQKTL